MKHFTEDAFERSFENELLGCSKRKKIKIDAMPTVYTTLDFSKMITSGKYMICIFPLGIYRNL